MINILRKLEERMYLNLISTLYDRTIVSIIIKRITEDIFTEIMIESRMSLPYSYSTQCLVWVLKTRLKYKVHK